MLYIRTRQILYHFTPGSFSLILPPLRLFWETSYKHYLPFPRKKVIEMMEEKVLICNLRELLCKWRIKSKLFMNVIHKDYVKKSIRNIPALLHLKHHLSSYIWQLNARRYLTRLNRHSLSARNHEIFGFFEDNKRQVLWYITCAIKLK